jgi:hypothetical protein
MKTRMSAPQSDGEIESSPRKVLGSVLFPHLHSQIHRLFSLQVTLVLQWHHISSFSDGCMELTLFFLA